MNFRLVWIDRAVARLTAVYLAALEAGEGEAVVQATTRVDHQLAMNPAGVGESRAGHERVMFEPPLTIYYEVHEDTQVVVVTSVRYFRQR